jgi:predicted nucleic acid-binding protein
MRDVVVIMDTSCLIALTKIGALDIVSKMYRRIVITEKIKEEFGEALPQWIEVVEHPNTISWQLLERILDAGEASAIALAITFENALLVLDDLRARKEARRLGFKMTGTLGVLFRAKQANLISALKPYIDRLQATGFRISQPVVDDLLALSNELP